MRAPIWIAVACLASPVLAGCVSAPDLAASGVPGSPSSILPYLDASDDHDHATPAIHDAGWNLDVKGWNPFTEDPSALGATNQAHVQDGYAYVSAYALPPEMKPGLAVVDLADPANPEVVGAFTSTEIGATIDVHVSEDGNFAALAGHRQQFPVPLPPFPVDPCTGVPLPGRPTTACVPFVPSGVQLLDVSDKSDPKLLVTYRSLPSGAHTVKLATIDGTLYAFLASYGVSWLDRVVSGVEILKFNPSGPAGPALERVALFLADEDAGGDVFVHDMSVQKHPITGDWLLYVAYWDGGVVLADVNDPAAPREIASWKEFDAAAYGNIHFVKPMTALLQGRHITVAAPEFGSAEHAGESYVLDTTDPTAPVLLGKWRLPGDPVNPGGYMHSPHNFDLGADGLLVMAHYHAGVWVLDLKPLLAGADAPPEIAYRWTIPPVADAVPSSQATRVWSAMWLDADTIVASDVETGLYTLDLVSDSPGTPPYAGLV